MNDIVSCIRNIETKYDVTKIKYDDVFLWDFIRDPLFEIWMAKKYNYKLSTTKSNFFDRVAHLLIFTSTTFFPLFFKKNCSLLFSNYGETRLLDGRVINRITNNLFVFDKNIVNIWLNNNDRIKKNQRYIEHYFLSALCRIVFSFKYDQRKLMGEEILTNILCDLGIDYDYKNLIRSLICDIRFFTKWFNYIKPKCIYQICYYDLLKQSATYVAKKMGIPVIEFQHGIANKSIAYTSFVNTDKVGIPDYFFSYGEKFAESVSEQIYDKKNVKFIGMYHIEQILLNSSMYKKKFLEKYGNLIQDKIVLTVAGQNTVDHVLIEFIKKLLNLYSNLYVIYKPRSYSECINIKHPRYSVEMVLDIYECITQSNICLTIYSTCAMDSLFLGTPVLLYNYNNLSKDTFDSTFDGIKSIRYIENETEFLPNMEELLCINKENVFKEGEMFYKRDNKMLLERALEEVYSERREKI